MLRNLPSVAALAAVATLAFAGGALADQPRPWEMNFQAAATPVAERIHSFNDLVFAVIVVITVFVLGLMAYIIWRFDAKRNPVPSKRSHHTLLEIVWTAAPVLILVVIAVPSLRLLYFMDRNHNPEMTLKVIGHQWYWSYEYPDNGGFGFDSIMVPTEELKPGQPRLLAVDNPIVLPVDTDVRVLITSGDVIHSWAVPSFGVKTDAVPGRTNETWVRLEREGTYYGQCSELCGVNHGFMPIAVRAVSKEAFNQWVVTAQKQFAQAGGAAPRVAGNTAAASR